jgi:Holliday junction resolvase
MRRAAKVDANQKDIVDALRKAGASVQSLAMIGKGVPDLLVGFQNQTLLMEIKDGNKTPSQRLLTEDQMKWLKHWKGGAVSVVDSVDAALIALGVCK